MTAVITPAHLLSIRHHDIRDTIFFGYEITTYASCSISVAQVSKSGNKGYSVECKMLRTSVNRQIDSRRKMFYHAYSPALIRTYLVVSY